MATAVQNAIASRPDLTFNTTTGALTYTGDGNPMADLVITLDAVDDTFVEGPERYQIMLANTSSTTGATIGIDASLDDVTTTINDTVGDGGVSEEVIWSFGVDQTVPEGDDTVLHVVAG